MHDEYIDMYENDPRTLCYGDNVNDRAMKSDKVLCLKKCYEITTKNLKSRSKTNFPVPFEFILTREQCFWSNQLEKQKEMNICWYNEYVKLSWTQELLLIGEKPLNVNLLTCFQFFKNFPKTTITPIEENAATFVKGLNDIAMVLPLCEIKTCIKKDQTFIAISGTCSIKHRNILLMVLDSKGCVFPTSYSNQANSGEWIFGKGNLLELLKMININPEKRLRSLSKYCHIKY